MKLRSVAALQLVVAFTVLFGTEAFARRHGHKDFQNSNQVRPAPLPGNYGTVSSSASSMSDDADLVRAVLDKRNVHFVEGDGVVVTQILPDDNEGLPHQKFMIQLSNGSKMLAVYNTDMGSRIPLKVGQKISIGGEFKMTDIGPLIHWLHRDPRHQRPDGYVTCNGVRYGGGSN